jgi:hypothetical protein
MQAKDILIDLFEDQYKTINGEFSELSAEAFDWRPDAEANSIGITLWHLGRVADFALSHYLEGRSVDQQRWFSSGWANKTGYDPRGLGARGMGVLTGYTQAEVAALPTMHRDDLFTYHNEVYQALISFLQDLPADGLGTLTPNPGEQPGVYFWSRIVLVDATRHLGEIRALKAMWLRL